MLNYHHAQTSLGKMSVIMGELQVMKSPLCAWRIYIWNNFFAFGLTCFASQTSILEEVQQGTLPSKYIDLIAMYKLHDACNHVFSLIIVKYFCNKKYWWIIYINQLHISNISIWKKGNLRFQMPSPRIPSTMVFSLFLLFHIRSLLKCG